MKWIFVYHITKKDMPLHKVVSYKQLSKIKYLVPKITNIFRSPHPKLFSLRIISCFGKKSLNQKTNLHLLKAVWAIF